MHYDMSSLTVVNPPKERTSTVYYESLTVVNPPKERTSTVHARQVEIGGRGAQIAYKSKSV